MVDLSGAMASQDARPLGPAPHETEPDVDNPTILYSYPPSRSAQNSKLYNNFFNGSLDKRARIDASQNTDLPSKRDENTTTR